jgi:hypothetical protein
MNVPRRGRWTSEEDDILRSTCRTDRSRTCLFDRPHRVSGSLAGLCPARPPTADKYVGPGDLHPAWRRRSALRAVSSCLRPEWTSRGLDFIAAFDKIDLRGLLAVMRWTEAFDERDLSGHLFRAIRSRLAKAFGTDKKPAAPAKPKLRRVLKPPAKLTRVPVIEKRVALGLKLLELKATTRSTTLFGKLCRVRFPDIDSKLAVQAVRIARLYGQRPEIYRCLSWAALFELSNPHLPKSERMRFEKRALAGEDVKGNEIRSARTAIQRPAARMAA